jgi:hypothetical protein
LQGEIESQIGTWQVELNSARAKQSNARVEQWMGAK